ncbi:hypothetical protein HY405_00825 [Candidatus Microgenomates bacterium]|nr:hypothetical protein [Candidatus Microgenomates bacterium]
MLSEAEPQIPAEIVIILLMHERWSQDKLNKTVMGMIGAAEACRRQAATRKKLASLTGITDLPDVQKSIEEDLTAADELAKMALNLLDGTIQRNSPN